tara:strand:+ start:112 stop:990 length:879 start_codon:yes stop_codon:yes gene_type:complete
MKSFQEFKSNLHEGSPKISGDSDVKKVLDNLKKGKTVTGDTLPKERIPLQSKQPFIKPDKKVINQLDALKNADAASSKNIMKKLTAREKMNRAQSDATVDMSANIKKSGNTYSPSYNEYKKNNTQLQKQQSAPTTGASSQVTLNKDARDIEPKFKKTDPTKLNTIKGIKPKVKAKMGVAKGIARAYSNRSISKPSRAIHKGGALLSGIGAGIDDRAKGRSMSRSIGKGITSFGAYMSAKPLARIPKVGPIISAVVGDIAQRKSGKVYDSVVDKVTGKKTKPDKPKSPLRGQL